jgi:DNA (cytosine-5)-methyltransferase 1
LAGKRKGLEGERSSLIEYAIRLVTDIRPSVFIWENVKGAFSSNSGADFWAILQAFANIGNYRLEWQLLNTKWFLPQNRERIYLIGHIANRSEPGVFPITENDARIDESA